MISNELNGSSLPVSVSSHITSFTLQDRPHFTAQHNVVKDSRKLSFFSLFCCCHSQHDNSEPVSTTNSELVRQ